MNSSIIFNKLFNIEKMVNKTGVKVQGKLPASKAIVKTTINVAIPSITEALLIAIVGLVDSYMVSSLGDYAISAVGLTNQPKFLLLAAFFAMSQAVSALVARRRGENKLDEAGRVLQHAVIIAVALSIGLSMVGFFFADPIISVMGSQPDTHAAATDYFKIISAGMFFNALTVIINAAQRGVGNTKIAMKANVTANIVNVILNFVLIKGRLGFPRLEVKGAAIATVIGSIFAFVIALISVARKHSRINLFKNFTLKPDKFILKTLSKLSLPAFVEQLIMRIGFSLYFIIIANLGTNANAAHHIGMNFLHISFSLADGLSVAAIALVGRSLGQQRQDLARIYSFICQRFGIITSCVIALIYIPFGRGLYSLFSNNPEVLAYSNQLMPIISIVVFIQITMIIFVSCLRAAGDVKYVAMVSLICIGLLRPIVSYLLCYTAGLGLVGAWIGLLTDQTVRLILSYKRYKKGNWLNIKI